MQSKTNYLVREFRLISPLAFSILQIVTQSDGSLTLNLVYREESTSSTHPHHCGKLTVHAEECFSSKTTTEMILRCSNLGHKDLFSRIVCSVEMLIHFHLLSVQGM